MATTTRKLTAQERTMLARGFVTARMVAAVTQCHWATILRRIRFGEFEGVITLGGQRKFIPLKAIKKWCKANPDIAETFAMNNPKTWEFTETSAGTTIDAYKAE